MVIGADRLSEGPLRYFQGFRADPADGPRIFWRCVVHPSVPFRNVKDLVAYGKANPGKPGLSATNGEGRSSIFSVELLRTMGWLST
jgi:hypothetical protein